MIDRCRGSYHFERTHEQTFFYCQSYSNGGGFSPSGALGHRFVKVAYRSLSFLLVLDFSNLAQLRTSRRLLAEAPTRELQNFKFAI